MLFGGDVDGNAFALVAVFGFHDHRNLWKTNFARGFIRIFGIGHRTTVRNRNTGGGQQFFGEFFILGDGFSNRAGNVHFRRLDTALFTAPTKAYHAAFGHAAVRNTPRNGSINDTTRTGAKAHIFV